MHPNNWVLFFIGVKHHKKPRFFKLSNNLSYQLPLKSHSDSHTKARLVTEVEIFISTSVTRRAIYYGFLILN